MESAQSDRDPFQYLDQFPAELRPLAERLAQFGVVPLSGEANIVEQPPYGQFAQATLRLRTSLAGEAALRRWLGERLRPFLQDAPSGTPRLGFTLERDYDPERRDPTRYYAGYYLLKLTCRDPAVLERGLAVLAADEQ